VGTLEPVCGPHANAPRHFLLGWIIGCSPRNFGASPTPEGGATVGGRTVR